MCTIECNASRLYLLTLHSTFRCHTVYANLTKCFLCKLNLYVLLVVYICLFIISYTDSWQCIWAHIHGLCSYDPEAVKGVSNNVCVHTMFGGDSRFFTHVSLYVWQIKECLLLCMNYSTVLWLFLSITWPKSLVDPGVGAHPTPPLKVVEYRSQKASECTI